MTPNIEDSILCPAYIPIWPSATGGSVFIEGHSDVSGDAIGYTGDFVVTDGI